MKTHLGQRSQILIAVVLVFALYGLLAYTLYGLTQRAPGANDFYSRWAGAQALFLRGENPYADSVTREIQMGMYGRRARPDEDQVAFAYPLYAAFVMLPLVGLTFAQAQALWMSALIFVVVGAVLLLTHLNRIHMRPITLIVLLLGTLVFYPSVRGIFLGQYALLVFFLLVAALVAIKSRYDLAAGILLALATVKPQPAVFLVPVVVIWAARNHRWKIIGGAVGGFVVLVALAMLWVPMWLLDFVQAIRKYADYEPVGPPVQTLCEFLFPRTLDMPVAVALGGVLIVWMLWQTFRSLGKPWEDFLPTISLVAIVTTLTAGRVGTPDQMLLLIPWLYWIGEWLTRGQWGNAAVAALVLVVLPWVVFLTTLHGNAEHVVVTLVLPFLTLVVYSWREVIGVRAVSKVRV